MSRAKEEADLEEIKLVQNATSANSSIHLGRPKLAEIFDNIVYYAKE